MVAVYGLAGGLDGYEESSAPAGVLRGGVGVKGGKEVVDEWRGKRRVEWRRGDLD